MACDAVRFEVIVRVAKMRARIRAATSAGYARDRIDHHNAFRKRNGRPCSERSGRRIATRAGYQGGMVLSVQVARFEQFCFRDLGQTEECLL